MVDLKVKNIGILEIHFHVKFLYTMMRICNTKETNVTVFTTKKIFSRIETYLYNKSKYKIILKEENESNRLVRKTEKNGFVGLELKGNYLVLVLEGDSEEVCMVYIDKILKNIF